MRLEVRRVVRWSAAVCLAFVLLGVSAPAADPDASARAARTQRGVLVLQVGSDWCVSGENVRKAFESREFARAVEGKYVLAVYDEMDSPTEAVKAKNEQVKDILIRTKRFPALTCYAPGSPLRVFAQIENIPGNVTPAKLAYAVARAAEKKDKAEALFRKAASAGGEAAADLYGEGFDLLAPMMGPFHPGELKKGKAAWTKEWEALKKLDADDRFGWVRHFNFDDYRCIDLLGKCVRDGDAKLARQLLSIPQKHFTPNQKQFMKVLEYARESDGTNRPLSPRGKALLKETLDLGRDTFWGQFAMGRLMMDGEKIESKGLYRAPVRPRPTGGSSAARLPFPLERTKSRLRPLKPTAVLGESQKLDIARGAVLRLIGKEGWDELNARPGSGPFIKAFLDDRTWLEDFAWSGTFASGKADPGDGAKAVLVLESLIYQDEGRWVPFVGGRFADNEGRRFMTALALVYPDKDEAWLADVLDAYRATARAGRLHKTAYTQPTWLWRFAVNHGRASSGTDNMAAQQRHLDKFVNLPCREYGGTCWMVQYRLKNSFGDSVHGPLYYKPWATAGEWPKRKYTQIVGGVCGELSKFGSATANAHGLPSTTVGQPGHCAYTRRLPDGKWEVNYSVTGHSQMHMCFWNRHPWQYVASIEKTYAGDRETRLSCERLITLAAFAEEAREKPSVVESFHQWACRRSREHYGAWKSYGDWVGRSNASLATARVWVRGCARGMKTGRQPLWDFLTPYFARVAKEKGAKALAEDLVAFAPLLRQPEERLQEEANFKDALKEWTRPLGTNRSLLAPVLQAMLSAQYGTRDYFSQALGWGGDTLMGDGENSELFVRALKEMVAERSQTGQKTELDFNPLILSASKAGNLDAFRQLASLQERLEPQKKNGPRYPASDFDASLLSGDGLLRTSSTCGWDRPKGYARGIDGSPCDGNAFHTDREKSPWAAVMLPGPAEICGVVIENRCAAQNQGRQLPLEVQVSEDGENWRTVYTDSGIRGTYRVDLRARAPRARYVRVRRTPEAKNEFFHLSKILVYGRKLY